MLQLDSLQPKYIPVVLECFPRRVSKSPPSKGLSHHLRLAVFFLGMPTALSFLMLFYLEDVHAKLFITFLLPVKSLKTKILGRTAEGERKEDLEQRLLTTTDQTYSYLQKCIVHL